VGNFHIAGGHVIFVVGNGFHLLRSDYISLTLYTPGVTGVTIYISIAKN
jgi:hypothetical protein